MIEQGTGNRFYRAFEDEFRGSRKTIRDRLVQYHPILASLRAEHERPRAVDLGCGRGEWLEALLDHGFEAFGVDMDEDMLAACRELDLPAARADIFDHLAGLATDSHHVVSAFHVVEHLDIDDVRALIRESLRVLVPGGVLIMETPNPENLRVASERFWLDPTHNRPLPMGLLDFAARFEGFGRTWIWRLNSSVAAPGYGDVRLDQFVEAVSPDYAVIAVHSAPASDLGRLETVLDHHNGRSMSSAADEVQVAMGQMIRRTLAEEPWRRSLAGRVEALARRIRRAVLRLVRPDS